MRLADDRARLAELVAALERNDTRILVTRDGTPAAVLIGVSELRSLEETIDILAEPELAAAIVAARAQVGRGEVVDQESVQPPPEPPIDAGGARSAR